MQEVSSRRHVIIYSRPGCHLCDEAKAVIQKAGCSDRFTLEEINIESDDELLRKYKYDIPVVTIDGVEAFRHRVNAVEFKEFLNPSTDYTDSV
ncbi:MAG TPA: glutaredoxin family protein [Pyrinomonadaceae bacterium]|nr:glutaredoxin family protein [Pyrinomonadaceae bacterium]